MFKVVLLSVAVAVTVVLGTTTQLSAPQPRVLEAAHCTFWACSETGELSPTERVCMHNCAGGACSPVDVCE